MALQAVDPETGELQEDPQALEDMDAPLHVRMPGTEEQLSFNLGSQYSLRDSTLKLGTIPPLTVEGQFQEGDRIKVEVEVEVEHVSFPPVKDRGFRVGTERRHHASYISARRI